jgi:hypothetical protein
LIASSTSITVNGSITANGGSGGSGNASAGGFPGATGSGGGIRLAALFIQGTGSISAGPANAPGLVRLEAFQQNFAGTIPGGVTALATPTSVTLPSGGPATVNVVSVAGVPIPTNPTGSFSIPDGTINQNTPATVVIQASNVPLGTVPTLYITSETGPDMTIQAPALTGTLASSTASVSVTFPPGYSRGYVRATWTQ